MTTFFSFGAEKKIKKENVLLKLRHLINWDTIAIHLKGFYKKDIDDKGGTRPYDPIKMFKAILLGQWYDLSDPALEEALSLRIDFMMFTDIELSEDCPDETTICRFRNKLISLGLDKKLFNEINNQLENFGLKVKKSKGAILDATIIESAAKPRRHIEIQEDRKENDVESHSKIIESKDPDSRWLKKGKKFYFGYKGFVAVDEEKGFINKIYVAPANVAEVKKLPKLIEEMQGVRVYADKGYTSKENRLILKNKKLKDGIMHKEMKTKQLTKWQKLKNKLISKRRYIVEQGFGTLKRRFNFNRASYMGLAKVESQFYLKAMCFNLLKASNMVKIA